jgi:hypothetical protein
MQDFWLNWPRRLLHLLTLELLKNVLACYLPGALLPSLSKIFQSSGRKKKLLRIERLSEKKVHPEFAHKFDSTQSNLNILFFILTDRKISK